MEEPIAYDPGAIARIDGQEALAEVTFQRGVDGHWLLVGETDAGLEFSVLFRADFLNALAARTREAAA